MEDTTEELRQLLLIVLSELTSHVSCMGTQLTVLGNRVYTLSHDVHIAAECLDRKETSQAATSSIH